MKPPSQIAREEQICRNYAAKFNAMMNTAIERALLHNDLWLSDTARKQITESVLTALAPYLREPGDSVTACGTQDKKYDVVPPSRAEPGADAVQASYAEVVRERDEAMTREQDCMTAWSADLTEHEKTALALRARLALAEELARALGKSRDEHRKQAALWKSIDDPENASYHKKQADEEDTALARWTAAQTDQPNAPTCRPEART